MYNLFYVVSANRKVAGSISDEIIGFFCRTMDPGPTQPLIEMSTKNIPMGEARPARKADIFAAICEPTVQKMWDPRCLTTLWACYITCRWNYSSVVFPIVPGIMRSLWTSSRVSFVSGIYVQDVFTLHLVAYREGGGASEDRRTHFLGSSRVQRCQFGAHSHPQKLCLIDDACWTRKPISRCMTPHSAAALMQTVHSVRPIP
jgi:hypothetical protein